MTYRHPALTAWLWWTALLVLLTGGAIAYLLRLDPMSNPEALSQSNLILAFTGVTAGICVIAATSKWWLSR